eukprot:7752378-Pyramimonas_sp.AAC.1
MLVFLSPRTRTEVASRSHSPSLVSVLASPFGRKACKVTLSSRNRPFPASIHIKTSCSKIKPLGCASQAA